MATLNDISRAVACRAGLKLDYVQDVANALSNDGLWPDTPTGLTNVLFAVAVEATPRGASAIAQTYSTLRDDEGNVAFDMLNAIVSTFLHQSYTEFSQLAYASTINVYIGTPAVRFIAPTTDGPPFTRLYAEDDDRPIFTETTTRSFTNITGKWIFDVVADVKLVEAVAA